MTIDLVEQIVDYIRKLAEPLVTKGYELVLKQVQFMLIMDIFWFCLGIAIACLSIIFGLKMEKAGRESDYSYDDRDFWGVIMAVLGGIVGFVMAGININQIVNIIVNPDWVAIQLIINMIGK